MIDLIIARSMRLLKRRTAHAVVFILVEELICFTILRVLFDKLVHCDSVSREYNYIRDPILYVLIYK